MSSYIPITITKGAIKKTITHYCFTNLFFHRFFYRQTKTRLCVLMYHRITVTPESVHPRQSGSFVSEKMFQRHVDYLMAHYSIISIEDLVQFVRQGTPLPPHPVLITFDDGYRDVYLYALPILKKQNLPAVMFASTGFINRQYIPWRDRYYRIIEKLTVQEIVHTIAQSGIVTIEKNILSEDELYQLFFYLHEKIRENLMPVLEEKAGIDPSEYDRLFCSWKDLIAMERAGLSVESHTVSHPDMPDISDDQIKKEVTASKQLIEEKLSKNVFAFAYPFGGYDNHITPQMDDLDILFSFTVEYGLVNYDELLDRRHSICRNGQSLDDNFEIFRLKATGGWRYFDKPWIKSLVQAGASLFNY